MTNEIRSPKQTLDLCASNEIVVDQGTVRRLEDLCSTMTNTCGLVEAILQLAVEDQSEKRTSYMETALSLSARGTRAIKMFLSEWSVLVAESKSRENSGRSAGGSVAESDLTRILNDLAAIGLTIKRRRPQPLAVTEREAVINALQETGGNKDAASRLLGIGRTTLYRKLTEDT